MSLWVVTVQDRDSHEFLNVIGPLNSGDAANVHAALMRSLRIMDECFRVDLPPLQVDMLRMEDPPRLVNPNNTDSRKDAR